MTINADGSMTMIARDIESGRVYRDGDSCAMKFKSYDLTWVLSAATDSLKWWTSLSKATLVPVFSPTRTLTAANRQLTSTYHQ